MKITRQSKKDTEKKADSQESKKDKKRNSNNKTK